MQRRPWRTAVDGDEEDSSAASSVVDGYQRGLVWEVEEAEAKVWVEGIEQRWSDNDGEVEKEMNWRPWRGIYGLKLPPSTAPPHAGSLVLSRPNGDAWHSHNRLDGGKPTCSTFPYFHPPSNSDFISKICPSLYTNFTNPLKETCRWTQKLQLPFLHLVDSSKV